MFAENVFCRIKFFAETILLPKSVIFFAEIPILPKTSLPKKVFCRNRHYFLPISSLPISVFADLEITRVTHQARNFLAWWVKPNFDLTSHISPFFAEIWQKNRQSLSKNRGLMSYTYPTVIYTCKKNGCIQVVKIKFFLVNGTSEPKKKKIGKVNNISLTNMLCIDIRHKYNINERNYKNVKKYTWFWHWACIVYMICDGGKIFLKMLFSKKYHMLYLIVF